MLWSARSDSRTKLGHTALYIQKRSEPGHPADQIFIRTATGKGGSRKEILYCLGTR